MKTQKIKEAILREQASEYLKNPSVVFTYDEDDARKYGVSLQHLEAIVKDLGDSGYLSRQMSDQGGYAWQITVDGLQMVEDESGDEEESEPTLRERVEQLEERVKALEEVVRRGFSS
jgi:CTP-dependent riboflavin kinase